MKTELLKRSVPMKADLSDIQSYGREALIRREIPHRRMEAWRFTDINRLKLLTSHKNLSSEKSRLQVSELILPEVAQGTYRILLTDKIDPLATFYLPDGIEQLTSEEIKNNLGKTLSATGCQYHWPVELNYANASYCLALKIKGNNNKLEIVHAPTHQGIQAIRVLLILEEDSNLDLTQINLGQGLQLSSLTLEVYLKRGSNLIHGLLAFAENEAGFLDHTSVVQEAHSHYTFTSVLRGWALGRIEPRITQIHGKARTVLRGLQIVEGNNQIDTHSYISFEGPEGELDQLHKSLADNKGHSIFNGIIRVPCLAQLTNASQLSRNLLLSAQARIDTKPELEIVADDVRCTHGATISQMQEDEVFYLQSRGLDYKQASNLVKKGYYQDILDSLPESSNAWTPLERVMQSDSPLLNLHKP
uniref:ABC transporter, membrane component n=1 Tax=Paulinella longichromatophora TaxID=1708747 RepID=A0A2H4ZQ20_9EUKA|nr:ABC transporter, membrane component [Paulinella longichromatophora]